MNLQASDLFRVKTGAYRPPVHAYSYAIHRGLPPFTAHTVTMMLEDAQVHLASMLRMAPLLVPKIILEGDPRVTEYVRRNITVVWQRAIIDILDALWYRHSGGELVWEINPKTKTIDFKEFRPVHPRDIDILIKGDETVGIRVLGPTKTKDGAIELFGPKSFMYIHNRRWNDFMGRSELRGAYEPWLEKADWKGARSSRKLWFYKCAFGGGIIIHPPGSYLTKDASGNPVQIPYQDIARQAITTAETGATWAFPAKYNDQGQLEWQYIPPELHGDGGPLIDYIKVLDLEITRGVGIPDDIVSSPETGSYAGRSVPLQSFYISSSYLLKMVFTAIREQILDQGVTMSFGKDAIHQYDVVNVSVDLDTLLPSAPYKYDNGQGKGLPKDTSISDTNVVVGNDGSDYLITGTDPKPNVQLAE